MSKAAHKRFAEQQKLYRAVYDFIASQYGEESPLIDDTDSPLYGNPAKEAVGQAVLNTFHATIAAYRNGRDWERHITE